MTYLVEIDGVLTTVEISGGVARIGGAELLAQLVPVPGTPVHVLAVGPARYRVLAQRESERGRYTVTLPEQRYDASALNERARAIRELSVAQAAAAGPAPLVAPMPGLVIGVRVAVGDEVSAGQGLVVMEAMKMENELRAGSAGTVRRIAVEPGTAVEKGAVLVELG